MTKAIKKHKGVPATVALQSKSADGTYVVGIGNLRVVIIKDESVWFAQGLEIDYAAQGETLGDVKKQFEQGLSATVNKHLRVYGNIEKILKVAPPEVWNKLLFGYALSGKHFFSQVSLHEAVKDTLPFGGIDYIEVQAAA